MTFFVCYVNKFVKTLKSILETFQISEVDIELKSTYQDARDSFVAGTGYRQLQTTDFHPNAFVSSSLNP